MSQIRNTKGFTLMELLVVISIITILSVATLNSGNSLERKRQNLRNKVYEIVTLFRTARNYAIANKNVAMMEGKVPKGGFGVYINKNEKSFIFFVDQNNDGKYVETDDLQIDPRGLTIRDIGISLKDFKGDETVFDTTENEAVVIFKPPEAEVRINKNKTGKEDFSDLEFTIDGGIEKHVIKINKISKFVETQLVQ